jgi:apolipoprotein N-acyltransferase
VEQSFSLDAPLDGRPSRLRALLRASAPTLSEWALSAASAALLVLSFPDFNLWPLAWVGLVPLMLAVARRPRGAQAFLLGWATASLFFYCSCYWLTHAMIHYGDIPRWLAYILLIPAPLVTGLFPALWSFALARVCRRRGLGLALVFAPFAWAALEWARLGITGQLWNALGYSQAYVPALIQPARWGGVYAVGFLLVAVNAAIAYLLARRSVRALMKASLCVVAVALVFFLSNWEGKSSEPLETNAKAGVVVVGVQPNVSANFGRSSEQTALLVNQHLSMSESALREWEDGEARSSVENVEVTRPTPAAARVVIWPESPMNFTYARDAQFRATVARFAREQRALVLFNSLEPAPAGGSYNSAVLVDSEGRLVAQYDKIRLLPFGEYVPLPRWLPAAWLLSGIVGDFTPGDKYPLMPLNGATRMREGGAGGKEEVRAGVFICFESAFPSIARTFAKEGADVLINISNDGYLGRTPVMRQHLANVVLRAVETGRPILRVTNTGISARITARGEVLDATEGFEPAVRTWPVGRSDGRKTFYTSYGDIFNALCAALSLLFIWTTFRPNRKAGAGA